MSATELEYEQTSTETEIPSGIDSTGSKLVYLYLDAAEEATIEELRTSLNMKRLALFPVLGTLESEGFVERDGQRYACCA